MSDRLFYTMQSPVETIEELSRVTLNRPISIEDQVGLLPTGASGTVVSVLGDGAAYLVEFTEPYPALAEDVDIIPGESRGDLVAGRLAH